MRPISNEEIYDAVLDDESLAGLPARLAEALGARSCVIHWRHVDGASDMMAHSGYYSDEQLADYARNYAWDDAWTKAALSPDRANQAWSCDDLVSERELERTSFYDGWIRGMGDDTYHCMGMSADVPSGFGLIGLHRSKAQGAFDTDDVSALGLSSSHLKRLFVIRSKLAQANRRAHVLEDVLSAIACPILVVSRDARLRYANAAAEHLILADDGLLIRQGRLLCRSNNTRFKAALNQALDAEAPVASDVTVIRASGNSLVLSIVGLPPQSERRDALVVVGGVNQDITLADRLRRLHGLSAAEVGVAMGLSEGRTPKELAEARNVSYETVKVQLRSLYMKLDVNRQADVIRAVQALAPLNVAPLASQETSKP